MKLGGASHRERRHQTGGISSVREDLPAESSTVYCNFIDQSMYFIAIEWADSGNKLVDQILHFWPM